MAVVRYRNCAIGTQAERPDDVPVGYIYIADDAPISVKTRTGWQSTISGGGTTPSGTGWRHVTAGAEDAAASTPSASDVGADPAGSSSAVQGNLTTHAGLSTSAHGGIVADTDARLSDARTPTAHYHAGVYEPANAAITTHISGTGSPHTAAGVGADAAGTAAAAVSAHDGLATPHAVATSVGGKAIPAGGIADAGTLSTHTGAAAPHSGHVQVGGQIGGTAASPDVRGLRTPTGPTLLTMGAVADGEYLRRVGADIVGGSPAGGTVGFALAPASNTTIPAGNGLIVPRQFRIVDTYHLAIGNGGRMMIV